MKKIAQLHLKNFKAFRDQVFEFGGKNVLIYGNNGSGKSSLFWAIYTFLQSSSKSDAEIHKYFRHFDSTNPSTFESLKNVFADAPDDAFVKMKWVDENGNAEEKQISETVFGTTNPTNAKIQEANMASDFINYRLLYNFFNVSHKHETNLWEVFVRDIFPYFPDDKPSFWKQIWEIKKPKKGTIAVNQFNTKVSTLNNDIELFLGQVETNANVFLAKNFLDRAGNLKIHLEYKQKIDKAWVLEKDNTIRKNLPLPNRAIKMSISVKDLTTGNWIVNHRPHSFLNEAILTRIAISIRIGALQTRLQTSDFKVLCLDDMLISLDMSNRMQVLKWLLNPSEKPYNSFQIILLTHDKAFYEITKHQIEGRQVEKIDENGTPQTEPMKTDWKFWELYNDEFHGLNQPHLATGNSHLELAEKYFRSFDFAACANYLRKECERLIRNFLPENQTLEGAEGETKGKLLQKLIDELKNQHDAFSKDFSPFKNLKLYKDILMNPLSHDSLGTSVFQAELREIMDDLIPKLQSLKSEKKIEIERGKKCLVDLKITDSAGMDWVYKIEFWEHLREFTFSDGSAVLSNPRCLVVKRINTSGGKETFNLIEKLNDVFRRAAHSCGVAQPVDKLSCLIKNP